MHIDLNEMVRNSGWLLTFIAVFIGGLAMNLTPCVYPMIPITISYFGGSGGETPSRRTGFTRAVLFVLGMALTYSVLGVSAARTGKVFGATLGSPYVVAFVSVVMVGMALSMFGVFQMAAPSSLLSKIQEMRDRLGWIGALFFGSVIGLVMAPCVGPFIVALLAYVSAQADPMLGFWLFFTLALGMGAPYIVLGYFTSALKSLPRPGTWMVWLERFFGIVLIGYAFSFWKPFIGKEAIYDAVLAGYLLAAAIYLACTGSPDSKIGFRYLKTVIVVLMLGISCLNWWNVSAAMNAKPAASALAWQPYSDEAVKNATAEGKPVMIDFYAKWCAACNELDEKTYISPNVIAASQGFVNLKADFTQVSDIDSNPTARRFKIQGLPTVVFISSRGKVLNDLRLEDFTPPDRMLSLMEKAAASH